MEDGRDEMRDVIQVMNFLRACWRASFNPFLQADSSNGRQDGLLWYKDIGQHVGVEFSMAVVQANNLLEDQSQIESGSLSSLDFGLDGMFVGIYDAHRGPETSHFVCNHLFYHLKRFASEQQSMSAEVIRKAYQATEEGFLSIVAKQWPMNPQIAAVGSCCLVSVICRVTLYIANLGDSRAVLGRLVRSTGEVLAIPLSAEHNVGIESVRQEMQSFHPDDPHIVVSKHDGIARRLVKTAPRQAAKKREIRYSDLNKIDRGVCRHFHDNITEVVIFLDSNLASRLCSVRSAVMLSTDGGTNLPAKSLTPNQLRPS